MTIFIESAFLYTVFALALLVTCAIGNVVYQDFLPLFVAGQVSYHQIYVSGQIAFLMPFKANVGIFDSLSTGKRNGMAERHYP